MRDFNDLIRRVENRGQEDQKERRERLKNNKIPHASPNFEKFYSLALIHTQHGIDKGIAAIRHIREILNI